LLFDLTPFVDGQPLDARNIGFGAAPGHRVVPEQAPLVDGRAAREEHRGYAVTLENRYRHGRDVAIAVVEGHQPRTVGEAGALSDRTGKHSRGNRRATRREQFTVIGEFRGADMQLLERVRRLRCRVRTNVVITEDGD